MIKSSRQVYCNGLFVCPMTVFPFIARQHAHFCSKQILTCSWLQIWHIHGWLVFLKLFFRCFDLSSRYNQRTVNDMPIIKKITIIRIFALKINNTTLKIINPEPNIKSQSGVEEVILTLPNNRIFKECFHDYFLHFTMLSYSKEFF